jgi:hypothetical protein
MANVTTVDQVCDYPITPGRKCARTGPEADVHRCVVGFDGRASKLDLCAAHRAPLETMLEPYLSAGIQTSLPMHQLRLVEAGTMGPDGAVFQFEHERPWDTLPASGGKPRVILLPDGTRHSNTDIRAWAIAHGIHVGERGRTPDDVITRFARDKTDPRVLAMLQAAALPKVSTD